MYAASVRLEISEYMPRSYARSSVPFSVRYNRWRASSMTSTPGAGESSTVSAETLKTGYSHVWSPFPGVISTVLPATSLEKILIGSWPPEFPATIRVASTMMSSVSGFVAHRLSRIAGELPY